LPGDEHTREETTNMAIGDRTRKHPRSDTCACCLLRLAQLEALDEISRKLDGGLDRLGTIGHQTSPACTWRFDPNMDEIVRLLRVLVERTEPEPTTGTVSWRKPVKEPAAEGADA
jgi:hypothetical protein